MRPAFAGNVVATVIFVGTVVVWMLLEVPQAIRRRAGATESDRGSLWLLRGLAGASALLAAASLHVGAAAIPFAPALYVAGMTLLWAGIALRWWCFRTLGRYFTFRVVTSADQAVVTSGPYRHLRHPSYAAILLALTGIGLSYGNWLSLAAITLIPLAGFVYRIHIEEGALSAALGSAYTDYAKGRKRLLPLVW